MDQLSYEVVEGGGGCMDQFSCKVVGKGGGGDAWISYLVR